MLSPRTLASAIAIALASLSVNVGAAGLGRLSVQSALGQPLSAEVEVTSLTREEAQTLSARLASPDAFRQAGLEYNPALASLRFTIETRNGRTFVRINSAQPINEPFVDLLVELNWASGKFVREYTFLLDPPELRTAREAASAAPATASPAAAQPAPAASVPPPPVAAPAPAPVAAAPAPRAASPEAPAPARPATAEPAAPRAQAPRAVEPAAPLAQPARSAPAGSVEVRKGDTLGSIARDVQPEGVSLDQSMIAIYRANPSAFIGNLNLVKAGASLTIPDRAAMAAIDSGEARKEVRLQSADFAAYRQRLAGSPAMVDGPRSGQTAAGAVGGRVEDRSTGAGGDQLRLSKPGAGATAAGGAVGSQASRAAAGEQQAARQAALKEANSRIADLEKNVGDLQKLIEMKNRSMADLQKQLDEARASSKAVTGAVVSAAPKAEAPKAEAPKAEAPKAEAPKAEAPKAEAPKAEAPKAEAPKAEAPKAAVAPPAPPAAEPSLVDDLLENPFLLPGLGGIALLGAGYGLYAMRRRRRVEKFEDSLIAADAFAGNSLFGSTGGQSVDTGHSGLAGGVASTSLDVQSTEVDPIAEADVYIAYGREAQAEEILKEALKRQPERQAIRAKLLEIYSGRKDIHAFEQVAREMHGMTGGSNEEWAKVAAMGLALDPANALYGEAAARSGSDAAAAPVVPGDDAAPLDFSTALAGTGGAPAPRQDIADTIEMASVAPDEGIPHLDFDLNLDSRIDKAAEPGRPEKAQSASDAPAAASLEARFDLPSLELDAPPVASAPGAGPLDLDLPALESLTQTGMQGAGADLDLSPISLDLEPVTVGDESAGATAGGAGRWQEMATKLDLASAYEEIGDKEGARELLQEVIQGGDSGQQQKARAMLSKIG